MRLEELYGNLKVLNSNKIVVMKSGNFYKTFGDDALILWKMFGYRVNNGVACFPISSFGGVISRLNRAGISVIVNSSEGVINYETALENTYNEYLENAISSNLINKKIEEMKEKINKKLMEDINNYDKIDEFLEKL